MRLTRLLPALLLASSALIASPVFAPGMQELIVYPTIGDGWGVFLNENFDWYVALRDWEFANYPNMEVPRYEIYTCSTGPASSCPVDTYQNRTATYLQPYTVDGYEPSAAPIHMPEPSSWLLGMSAMAVLLWKLPRKVQN